MSSARTFDVNGSPIALGKELGRGGEGAVYDVQGRQDLVAKLYHSPPKPDHAAKLAAMTAMANDRLMRVAAWPSGTLHGASRSVIGFLMPKVGGHRPVFQLYGPKLRLQEFPRADWRFLIHAASNAARAFSTVHSAGLVAGDVNHGNLVVAQDGTVRLIDCDSFQVSYAGKTWTCPVGVGTHQPPEMQSVSSYSGVHRTTNHDNFGLAVIIFQLLCMARHPFAGRHLGSGEPPSIEEAIARSRYAYSRDRARTAMAPPPGSLPIDALTPRIQDLFENAFSPGSVRGGRPNADQWLAALQELGGDLRQCSVNQGHHYRKGLSRCPWCDIEAASGTPLFPAVFVTTGGQASGMVALWQQVTTLTEPPPLPPPPNPHATTARPSSAAIEAGRKARKLKLIAYGSTAAAAATALTLAPSGLGVLLAGGIALAAYAAAQASPGAGAPNEFKRRLDDAQREWGHLRSHWLAPMPGAPFGQERAKLNALKARHDALPSERAKRLQKLAEQLRQKQQEDHLDRFPIANARISGIGRAKIATLSAYGIDTAGDIVESRILGIPGFGPATVAKLVTWRRQHEQTFRFDPNRGVAPADMAKVERDIAIERSRLEAEVAAGLAKLKATSAAADTRRRMLEGKAAELLPKLAQATADANAAPGTEAALKRAAAVAGVALAAAVVVGLSRKQPAPISTPLPSPVEFQRPGPINTAPPAQPERGSTSSTPATPGPIPPPAPPHSEPSPRTPLYPEQRSAPPAPTVRVAPSLSGSPWPQPTSPASAGTPEAVERVTTRQGANVREAPNGSAAVVRTAPAGAVFRVFSRNSGWVQVGDGSPWGWIHSSLLDHAP